MNEIQEKLKLLPDSPGVYIMLDKEKNVIYVGKARILKNRVRQYFHSTQKTEKVAAMVSNIADFYYVITKSEIDALSLENNLIKKYKPKYNILLKDDKTYPYIKVALYERYPSFSVSRKLKKGSKYFGPYMGGVRVRDVLEIVNMAFGVRICTTVITDKPKKPCLNYHIHRCPAPCAHMCTEEEYAARVKKAMRFLDGDDSGVENCLCLFFGREFLVFFFVEGGFGHGGTLFLGNLQHVVVEAGDSDMAVLVDKVGDKLGQDIGGIGHGTAEEAGMEVLVRAGDADFDIAQTAKPYGDGGDFGGNHRGVGNQNHVGFEHFLVFGAPFAQGGGTDFFLAFEHELDVAGKAVFLDHVFEGFGVHEGLAFVVVGAPGIEAVADNLGFEGLGLPEFEGIDGHHVVMAIDEDGLGFWVDDFFAIDHGVALGGHHFGLVGTGFENLVSPVFGGTLHIGFMGGLGADGGYPDQSVEFFQETVFVGLDVIFDRCHNLLVLFIAFSVGLSMRVHNTFLAFRWTCMQL